MIERVFSFIVEVNLAVSLLIFFILFLLKRIKTRYTAQCQSILWLILAIRLVIPFNLNLPSFLQIMAPYRLLQGKYKAELLPLPGTVSMIQLLTTIWIIGGCVYFLYHIIQYSILKNSLKRWSCSLTEQATLHLFRSIKYKMNIYHPIDLRISPTVKTPMLAGIFHPHIILPECPLGEVPLQMVLRHELVHFKRRDSHYKALLLLVGTLHWFNPLVHRMIHEACKAIETSCDSQVVAGESSDFLRTYALSLIEVAKLNLLYSGSKTKPTVLATYFESSKELLEQRFSNLFSQNKKSGHSFLMILALGTVLGSMLICFRGNDCNADWAQNIRPTDIAVVEVQTKWNKQPMGFSSTDQTKQAIAAWLNRMLVEPALIKKSDPEKQVTYIVTQQDGRIYEISMLGPEQLALNGKEYRSFETLSWFE